MDQDISHAVTAPSPEAGDRPRYSIVLKLAITPRSRTHAVRIALTEWGARRISDPSP